MNKTLFGQFLVLTLLGSFVVVNANNDDCDERGYSPHRHREGLRKEKKHMHEHFRTEEQQMVVDSLESLLGKVKEYDLSTNTLTLVHANTLRSLDTVTKDKLKK